MNVRRELYRRTKALRRTLALVRATGRPRPDFVPLQPHGHRIYVDRSDARGLGIVRGLGRGHQPRLLEVWRRLIDDLAPGLVVDVGVNYGEFLLSPRYPPRCSVIGVEANTHLVPLIEKSIRHHPDAASMRLVNAMASDVGEGEMSLRVDRSWTGSASAVLASSKDGADLDQVTVPVARVDDLVAAVGLFDCVVWKVDVEGWEERVLGGMVATVSSARSAAGLVEFDPVLLRRAGSDPEAVLRLLDTFGSVYAVGDGPPVALERVPADACDLLVVRDERVAERVVASLR